MRRWGALLALLVAALTAVPVPAASAATPRRVLFIGVPDLRWTDLDAMPVLRAFSAYAAVGVLSVRSEGTSTRCGDGLLELSAGTRVPSGLRTCTPDAATLSRLRERARHDRYGAHIGTLGDRVGVPVTAVGAAAATMLAGSRGSPVPTAPSVGAAFAAAPTALVAVVDDGLYGARDRRRAAAAVDQAITAQFKQAPPDVVAVVAGISDGPTGGPHLHPLLVAGSGFAHRELTSPTTGRAPYVQLFDVTATLLALRGSTSLPSFVSGRAVQVTGRVVPSLSSYVDVDRHARRALSVGHPTFSALCGVLLGVLLLAAVGRREATWLARPLVLAPLAPWLLQLAPWWRWGIAGYVAGLVVVALLGGVAVTVLARRSALAALLAGPVVVAGVLLVDQIAGSGLQLSAPFGDNPLVAGRFHGMGNIAFGLAMGALLLVAAVVAAVQPSRRRAVAVAAGVGILGIVIDGAPGLGDDVGGLLTLLPAVALLVAVVARVTVTAGRVVAVGVATVAIATVVALVDYSRPPGRQTHAGRFIGQILHGGAWQVVHRKFDAMLASFGTPLVTALVVVAVVLIVHWRRSRPVPGIAAAVIAVAVVAVLGSALNDSGIFVAAAALLGLVPAVLAVGGPPGLDSGGPRAVRGDTRGL